MKYLGSELEVTKNYLLKAEDENRLLRLQGRGNVLSELLDFMAKTPDNIK